VYLFFTNKLEITRQIFIFILFTCYTWLSLSWSNSLEYGLTKTTYLGLLNFYNVIAAAIIIVSDQQRLRRLMFGLLLIPLIYVVVSCTIIMGQGPDEKVNFTGVDYSGIALVICAGISVLVCYMIDPSLTTMM
jgi:hypothetical protein